MKKILFVISNLKVGGGAEKSVTMLAKGLSKFYDVEVLTFYDFEDEYELSVNRESFGYSYSNSLFVKAWRLLVRIPFLLRKFLKKKDYDLVVANASDANIPCLLAKRWLLDYPLWTVIRNNVFDNKHPYYRFRNLHRFADKRVALTEALSRKVPYSCVAIGNALDLEEVRSLWDADVEEQELFSKKTIVMVGRLASQKNHKWFFDVFASLEEDVNLLVIGSGPLEEELKAYAANIPGIHFLGVKKNVYAYLRKADVFVLPSLFEGMPRVLMEALACGAVCVVNDCETGPRELLGVGLDEQINSYKKTDYGYLVPFNDKEQFVAATKQALKQRKQPAADTRFGLEEISKRWKHEISIS